MRLTTPLLVALCVALSPAARAEELTAETPDQKALYELGSRIAKDFQSLGVTAEELAFLKAGMDDFYAGKVDADPSDRTAIDNIRRFQRERVQAALEREKAAGATFLAEAAKQEGAKTTDSGMVFVETTAGSGSSPSPEDMVKVTYKGTLRDGTVFDSRLDAANPASFPLNGVIPCWQEALQRMAPGGKARFYCPSKIAYGESGSPPAIPPGAALQFEVELLEVIPAS